MLSGFFWRNRVISVCTPRIAAKYSPNSQVASPENAMNLQSLYGINGARRKMPAGFGQQWGNGILIEPDGDDHQPYQHFMKEIENLHLGSASPEYSTKFLGVSYRTICMVYSALICFLKIFQIDTAIFSADGMVLTNSGTSRLRFL